MNVLLFSILVVTYRASTYNNGDDFLDINCKTSGNWLNINVTTTNY